MLYSEMRKYVGLLFYNRIEMAMVSLCTLHSGIIAEIAP